VEKMKGKTKEVAVKERIVKEAKTRAVELVRKQLEETPVIAMLDMHKMPSRQMQRIRKGLGGDVTIKMVKKSTLMFAMEKCKKDLKKLEEAIPSQPAILLTNMEPFKLYALISKLKFPNYAKEGDVVEQDVNVSAGPTSLMPGPVISELQKVGIPATIQDGKIAIRSDKVVLKSGEAVTGELSSVLRKLNIQPVKIGINVVIILKDGEAYGKDALEIVNELPKQIPQASQHALNLSVFICYPTKQNIKILIAKAANGMNAINALASKNEKKEEEKKEDVKEEVKENIKEETKEEVKETAKSNVESPAEDAGKKKEGE